MEMDIIVLGMNRYSFADRDTGELRQGTTIHYTLTTPLQEDNKIGHLPAKATFKYEMFDLFRTKKFPFKGKALCTLDPTNRANPIKVIEIKDGTPITI